MSLLGNVKAGMMNFFGKNDPRFNIDINVQLDFLNKLPAPKIILKEAIISINVKRELLERLCLDY